MKNLGTYAALAAVLVGVVVYLDKKYAGAGGALGAVNATVAQLSGASGPASTPAGAAVLANQQGMQQTAATLGFFSGLMGGNTLL